MTAALAGVAAAKVGADIMEGQDESGKQVLQIEEEEEENEEEQQLHHQEDENDGTE